MDSIVDVNVCLKFNLGQKSRNIYFGQDIVHLLCFFKVMYCPGGREQRKGFDVRNCPA